MFSFKYFQLWFLESVLNESFCIHVISLKKFFINDSSFSRISHKFLLVDSPPSLQWRHNEQDSVPNHQRLDCLLNLLFRRRSKTTSKLPVAGLCEGNSPVIGEFPAQRASYAENASIGWRHHAWRLYELRMSQHNTHVHFRTHDKSKHVTDVSISPIKIWNGDCQRICLQNIHLHSW